VKSERPLREHLSSLVKPGTLLRLRMLRPFRRWLRHRALWTMQRESVARGVAIGLFFGILTPVAQIFFAAIAAIFLRGSIAVAALATLVTNPLTFPFVYYGAYRIGSTLVAGNGRALEDVALSEEAAEQALEIAGWFPTLLHWASSVGPALAVGVLVLAVAAAVAGYFLVHLAWRLLPEQQGKPPRST